MDAMLFGPRVLTPSSIRTKPPERQAPRRLGTRSTFREAVLPVAHNDIAGAGFEPATFGL
jgi:hypothetical protein